MRYVVTLTVTLFLATTACGGSDSSPIGPGTTLPNGSMSAKIDGVQWNATAVIFASNSPAVGLQPRILSISGADTFVRSIAFALSPSGPGTYTVGSLTALPNLALVQNNLNWAASVTNTGSSGTVTLTTLTSNSATGTFSFFGVAANSSTTGTRTVSDGVFNVTF